jgi:hypothetical protein
LPYGIGYKAHENDSCDLTPLKIIFLGFGKWPNIFDCLHSFMSKILTVKNILEFISNLKYLFSKKNSKKQVIFVYQSVVVLF